MDTMMCCPQKRSSFFELNYAQLHHIKQVCCFGPKKTVYDYHLCILSDRLHKTACKYLHLTITLSNNRWC